MAFLLFLGVLVLGPGRQPQIASAGERVVVVVGETSRILVHLSNDGGRTFSSASPIPVEGKMPLGMRRGPRVAVTREAILVTAILGEQGGGKDGDVFAWRSADWGKTWSSPEMINRAGGSAREGLHGMAANARGEVLVAWLDLRRKGTLVYGARSKDGGRTWEGDEMVYESPSGSVCECCSVTPSVSESGAVAVMFRNHVGGARDMYLAGGRPWTARKLGTGTWPLEACPMDGGDLKLDPRGRAAAVWRREKQVFASAPGEPKEALLGEGKDGVVAWLRETPVFAWTDSGRLRLQRGLRGKPQLLDARGSYASAATLRGGVAVAWESPEGVKVTVVTSKE